MLLELIRLCEPSELEPLCVPHSDSAVVKSKHRLERRLRRGCIRLFLLILIPAAAILDLFELGL